MRRVISAKATRVLQIQADKAIDECFEGKQIRDWVTPTPSGHAHLAKRLTDTTFLWFVQRIE